MASVLPKLLLPLAGRPILDHTLAALQRSRRIHRIVVALPRERFASWQRRCALERRFGKVAQVVPGGETRMQSVARALEEMDPRCDLVVVHDGARPLVTNRMLDDVVRMAWRRGAAVVGVPVGPTIKQLDRAGQVQRTLDRSVLWEAQTPQAFRREVLQEAYAFASRLGWEATDDAQVVERLGVKVWLVPGSATNIKITTPQDLAFAEWLVKQGRF